VIGNGGTDTGGGGSGPTGGLNIFLFIVQLLERLFR